MQVRLSSLLPLLFVLLYAQLADADFGGPSLARHALSPGGNLLVRIAQASQDEDAKDVPKQEVSFYEFDAAQNSYVRRSSFLLNEFLGQMLNVSNAGDLIVASLSEQEAIHLYSREGKLCKSWDLGDFLTKEEINACLKTGATLQWLEEGQFFGREFCFRGPSQLIRATRPPFTVMRGLDATVSFSVVINAETAELTKDTPEEEP